jgi:hypothetical protein
MNESKRGEKVGENSVYYWEWKEWKLQYTMLCTLFIVILLSSVSYLLHK